MTTRTHKANWFPTLNEALDAEGLIQTWPVGRNLNYGETESYACEGRYISVYRETNGRYERPVHYATLMDDTYPREVVQPRPTARAIRL